jgi:Mrp family chromosome partitioning ATPase
MDRIRKALDLARLEREQGSEPAPLPRIAAEPTPMPRPATDHTPPEAQFPASITYSITRVFTPDSAVLESNRVVDPASDEPAATAFRMLRTQVLQRMVENSWRSLAVLSPGADDGKTTTAINLALNLANDSRHTVLLIDSDLKRPSIAAALGIEPEFGLDDVLRGSARVEQCLYHPQGFDRLVILPTRAPLANSSEILAGPRGKALVAELRTRYAERILVFDLPPVLGADDALAFLPLLECGLVVVAERATRREDLVRCMELLRKTPLIGTVVTKATYGSSGYG